MPVSTTHVISSAIMGVGTSKGIRGVRWGVARTILIAWVITIPAAGLAGALVGRPQRARPVDPASTPSAPEDPHGQLRLIPRDEKFFDLFVADGDNLLRGRARARGR